MAAATRMSIAARRRCGTAQSMKAAAGTSSHTSGHWAPTAKVMETPSKAMRFQFQKMTSRGA